MTGGPELRPAATESAAAGARSAGGRLARPGDQPPTPFDALLDMLGPQDGAAPAAEREARPTGRLGADLRRPSLPSLDSNSVGGLELSAEAMVLDAAQQGQSLAQGVAERIAASLQGEQSKGTPAAALEVDANGRRDAALAASIAVAASLARRADGVRAAPGGVAAPALAVMHRETVIAAGTLAGVAARAAGYQAGVPHFLADAAAAQTGVDGSEQLGVETGAARQGRAEQLMPADRPAAARGAAPLRMPEGGAGAPGNAGSGNSGGELRQPGGEPARGPAIDGSALGLAGVADQRQSTAAPSAAVPAAQAGAAPPAFSAVPGAVKVLHIQLHPAELGVLEVRMRMTDGGLEVRIESSRQETVALLKNDRDTLESVLRGAGHALDAVTVSIAEKGGGASGQPSQDGWQPPASGARPEAQAGSPREQGGRFEDRAPSRPDGQTNEEVHDDQDQPAVAVRPRGALYL